MVLLPQGKDTFFIKNHLQNYEDANNVAEERKKCKSDSIYNKKMDEWLNWLLEGEPWVVYRTRLDLLHQNETDPQVVSARSAMLAHPLVRALIGDVKRVPWPAITNHSKADHPLHKLVFLADLGLKKSDGLLDPVISLLLAHPSNEGIFQVQIEVPVAFGGSGKPDYSWMLCDAPSILYCLYKLGFENDQTVQSATKRLAQLVRENGWPCAAAPELGKFHGPGSRSDPCPYATLIMLKALVQFDSWRESTEAQTGAEALLHLWEHRREKHPYLFHMGTDFCKLKAPFVWYNLLHVLDVFSQFPKLRNDARLLEMVQVLRSKADPEGRFTPESVYQNWKDWDFGQKKVPSRWITLMAKRILQRIDQ
jgi:hypothetical protein